MKDSEQPQTLRVIGIWATIWWAVSCLWVVDWVWASRHRYVMQSTVGITHGFFKDLGVALRYAFDTSAFLRWSLYIICIVWIISAIKWLYQLKTHKLSYRAAFKDLFLTIRK